MSKPIFLYPSLNDELKDGIFQAKKYEISYTYVGGEEKKLDYDPAEAGLSINLLKTDGVWSADKFNLRLKRTIALKNFKKLFGADGIACKNATLGVSVIWTSPDSRQRGSKPIMEIHAPAEMSSETQDHSFLEGELEIEFPRASLRGEIDFSIVLYISKAGTPAEDENHLANEEGFVLGEFDSFILKIDGNGSLFPVFEVYEQDQPLWYVRCDWTDPVSDLFSETVSININKAHKNYKYIDRTQKTFCSQLLVEVMSSALCCIIEKIRADQYLDQILGDEELERGTVGEAVRYFADTLGWDCTSPDKLSLSTRKFFDGRITG